jgi:hypothetical protein
MMRSTFFSGRQGASGDAAPDDPIRLRRMIQRRLVFYGILTALAACGLIPGLITLGFLAFFLPGLILLIAPYVWLYLPLIDWPIMAWRATGKPAMALLGLGLAMVIPVGAPLLADAAAERAVREDIAKAPESAVSQALAQTMPVGEPSARPGPVTNIMVVDDPGGCGQVCQSLLWSGAVDHVIGDDEKVFGATNAILYTVGEGEACKPPTSPMPPSPVVERRNNYCILYRDIENPTYDAVVDRVETSPGLPWDKDRSEAWVVSARRCDAICHTILSRRGGRVHPLKAPLGLHLESRSAWAVGLYLDRNSVEIGDADAGAVLKAAFGLDTSGFHPRPGFAGDVEHGNPGRLTQKQFQQQQIEARKEARKKAFCSQSQTANFEADRKRAFQAMLVLHDMQAIPREVAHERAYNAAHSGEGLARDRSESPFPPEC